MEERKPNLSSEEGKIPASELDMENSPLVRINFDVPKSIRQQFKAHAALEGKSMGEVMNEMVLEYIKNKKEKK